MDRTEGEILDWWEDQIGQRAIFTYFHGEEQTGVVTSVGSRFVFVRFHGSTSEACDPAQLRLAAADG